MINNYAVGGYAPHVILVHQEFTPILYSTAYYRIAFILAISNKYITPLLATVYEHALALTILAVVLYLY